MWGDQFDPLLLETGIERIAVVGAVADQSLGLVGEEAGFEGVFDERDFMRRSTCNAYGDRKTSAVCHCHELRTFAPLWFFPRIAPFFGDHEGAIDETLGQIQPAPIADVDDQCFQDALHHPRANPLLEATVTGLIRRVSSGQIAPRSSGAQHPENPIQDFPGIPPWPTAPIGSARRFGDQRLENFPLFVRQVHCAPTLSDLVGVYRA